MINIKPYIQGAILLGAVGMGVLCGKACTPAPKPITLVPPDTVVIEKPIIVFKDRPELVEKVHLATKPTLVTPEHLHAMQPADDAGIDPRITHPVMRVVFDGEKIFTQEHNTVKYGWTGIGRCELQTEVDGPWIRLTESPLDLLSSSAIAIPEVATPAVELERNRFTIGAGYGNSGWVAAFGISRSLVWKNRFTKAVMPDELGAQVIMHASRDIDGIVTGSWRF